MLDIGSTGASAAILRHLYTYDEQIKLAKDGIIAYKAWSHYLKISKPKATYSQCGVLWYGGRTNDEVLSAVNKLKSFKIQATALSKEDIIKKFPNIALWRYNLLDFDNILEHECKDMNTDTLSLFEEDAGYFDPTAALDDLVQACKRDNIQIKMSSQVIDIKRNMSNVTGVTVLNKDSIKYDIDTSIIVNCAGPWYNEILNFANIKSPMNLIPTRIQVLYKNVDTDHY